MKDRVLARIKQNLESRGHVVHDVKNILLPLLAVVPVLLLLWLWYHQGQQVASGVCSPNPRIDRCEPYYPFELDGTLGYIEEGISRNISHINDEHLRANITLFSLVAVLVVMFERSRMAFSQLFFTFTSLVIITPYFFSNLVGFSGMVYGTMALAVLATASRLKTNFSNWRNNTLSLIGSILLLIIITVLLFDVVEEAAVVIGIIDPIDYGIGDSTGDAPEILAEESLEFHILGFIIGSVVWVATHLVAKRSGSE